LYADDWALLPFVSDVLDHGIRFQYFFAEHGVHRMFFPNIIFFASALLTNFNVKANMYISWFLVTATYIVYLVYLKRTIKCETSTDRLKCLFLGLILGFYCFNLVQVENTIWGFQLGFFMVGIFSVLCFYFFYRSFTENKNLFLLFSMIFGFIAAFSSFHGIFAFPVILFVLFLLRLSGEKIHIKYFLTIVLTTILTYGVYFSGLKGQPDAMRIFPKYFLQIIVYFFTAVGNSFTFLFTAPAFITGMLLVVIGITITIYLILKKKIRAHIFPLCLIYFGYAFCIAIAGGRSAANGGGGG
jgi:hypothetical protein